MNFHVWIFKFEFLNLNFQIWIFKFEFLNLNFQIWIFKFEFLNLNFQIWIFKLNRSASEWRGSIEKFVESESPPRIFVNFLHLNFHQLWLSTRMIEIEIYLARWNSIASNIAWFQAFQAHVHSMNTRRLFKVKPSIRTSQDSRIVLQLSIRSNLNKRWSTETNMHCDLVRSLFGPIRR